MELERFITPWMLAHGFDLSTPQSVMEVAGRPSDIAYAKAVGSPYGELPSPSTVLAPGTPEWWAKAQDLPGEFYDIALGKGGNMATTTATPIPEVYAAGPPALPVAGIAAFLAGLYGLAQAFGLGEGGGLFGLNILGGDVQYVDGVPIGGPGVLEPTPAAIRKQWTSELADFWQLHDGRIIVRGKKTNRYKIYRPAKHIVIPENPRIGTLLRGARRVDTMMRNVDKRMKKIRPGPRIIRERSYHHHHSRRN